MRIMCSIFVILFSILTVCQFGSCTVFVQCVWVVSFGLLGCGGGESLGVTVLTLGLVHCVSQRSAHFCCLNKSCFHKHCNICFIRNTIMHNTDISGVAGEFEHNNEYFHKIKVLPPLMAATTIDSCTAQERILPSFHGLPILSASLS